MWGVWPEYSLQGKGIAGGKGITFFTLDTERLYRMVPGPTKFGNLHGVNSDGFRDAKPSPSGKKVMTVSGDSFPMGLVVDSEQTFPQQLEGLLTSYQVYNMGVQGYGPDQSLLAFKRHGLPLKPSRALFVLYPSNDFNDLLKNQLFDVDAQGRLSELHPNLIEKIVPTFRLVMAFRLITTQHFLPPQTEEYLSRELFNDKETDEISDAKVYLRAQALMRAVIRDFKKTSNEHSIKPTVIVIPSYREFDLPGQQPPRSRLDAAALALCREEGLEVIDLYPSFLAWRGSSLYSDADKHLSVIGHSEAAQAIAQGLTDTQL
jgi:hypothetical protein